MSPTDQPKGIIPWFANNPVAANLLLILIISLGVLNMGSLNKEAFPSLTPNRVAISVSNDSGSAKENEEGIAIPLEEALQGVSGIKTITTSSTASATSTSIEMLDGYDIDTLLDDVKDKVDQISSFPDEADPAVVTKATREEHSIWIQLYGETDRRTLQQLTNELESDLLANENISATSISGWLDPAIMIDIDKNKLEAYGLTLSDIATAINAESSPAQVATLRDENIYLTISASEQAYIKSEFSRIPVLTNTSGGKVLLGNIANIRDTFDEDDYVLSRFNRQNSLGIQILTTGTSDISNSVTGAKAVIQDWRDSGRLPANVKLGTWYDRSESINQRLELMVENAITGVSLVFVLLAIFLNVTVAFWVAMGLPFIFFGTLFFMGTESIGLTLNMFTTFGFIMALGIVVDDAVVVGESVYTVRSKEGDTIGNTIKGTMLVAIPTLFGVFTTVAAFWALSNIEGRLGQLYSQFATVVAICLVLSVIESKIILPAHLAHINTQKSTSTNPISKAWAMVQKGADYSLQWFSEHIYRPTIDLALNYRYAVSLLFIATFILVISMPFTGAIRVSFFPQIPGDTVRGELTMYNDVSYGQTNKVLLELEQKAYQADIALRSDNNERKRPTADNIEQAKPSLPSTSKTSTSNQPEAPSKPKGEVAIKNIQVTASDDQSGNIRIELDDNRPYTSAQFASKWQQLSGMSEGVKNLRIRSARETVDALKVELRGNDSSVLNGAMEELLKQLATLPAVTGIEQNNEPTESRLTLKLTDQGRLLGLSTSNLATQVARNFDGQVVQEYQRDNSEVEVHLGYPSEQKESPAAVMNTKVVLDDGTRVPLSTVATLSQEDAETRIIRIDGKRSLYLSAEVDKDTMSSTEVVEYLQGAVVPQMKRQFAGVSIYFSGEAEQREKTQSSMSEMFLIALLIIYGLLAIPLKSYSQPLIIMMAIPFGIIGALLGHWMNNLALGIFSLNGILALSGVVVNDSLLLVSRFNDLRHETSHVKKAISLACRSRLRAVLLTSFTTFAGLIPILWETSRQAQMLIPAAVSLAYGIMFATVITLILIPVLLMIKEDIHQLINKLKTKTTEVLEPISE
ncbi:efflux RND transporter permease subunit [Marinomonas rhizomae]|uniref:Multidrug efflux pump subunit AcrB n=1 Tax=Marinomonas rhizomae TaxID=491948 RepID=A0A366JIF2_9GAMM|nr:efflux RND transporter permease subunit [Marinomonas rhizomae]RBP85588.1 multidrug efflux pump subunit AcrB [Marinomonas rhizomae]RNF75782.1 efflux RND transporter permease subunit [Marinomonas rhizomae]